MAKHEWITRLTDMKAGEVIIIETPLHRSSVWVIANKLKPKAFLIKQLKSDIVGYSVRRKL